MKRLYQSATNSLLGCGLNLLSEDDLLNIHYHTLEILDQTGIRMEGEEARKIFRQAGANVDDEERIVKIPSYMVEEAIRTAPSRLILAGRIPENDLVLEGGRVYVTPFGASTYVVDENGKYKESTKQDLANAATLTDALDNIDLAFESCTPRDKDARMMFLHIYDANAKNTAKHVINSADNKRTAEILIEMASQIAGGFKELQARPIVTSCGCPISPLTYEPGLCESLVEFAKANLPYLIVSMALAGGTAPITLAGLLALHNAEVLGGIVLSQLVRKGAPVIYGSASTTLDLRKGGATVGCPEMALVSATAAKLAQFYNLPSFVAGT